MKKLVGLVALILALVPWESRAVPGTGTHGATGIQMPGSTRVYLFDLVEKNLHLRPYFKAIKPRPSDIKRLEVVLDRLENVPYTKIASKIAEIRELDPVSAFGLLEAIEMFNWYRSPIDLAEIKIPDAVIDWEALRQVRGSKFQIATRQDRMITVNGRVWDLMDENSKTATIFHEILYALTVPTRKSEFTGRVADNVREYSIHTVQEPRFARAAVAGLFHSRMSQGLSGLNLLRDKVIGLPIFSRPADYSASNFGVFPGFWGSRSLICADPSLIIFYGETLVVTPKTSRAEVEAYLRHYLSKIMEDGLNFKARTKQSCYMMVWEDFYNKENVREDYIRGYDTVYEGYPHIPDHIKFKPTNLKNPDQAIVDFVDLIQDHFAQFNQK